MLEHIRLLLIALGALIIVGIIVDSIRRGGSKASRVSAPTVQPRVMMSDPEIESVSPVRRASRDQSQAPVSKAVTTNDLIIISVMHPTAESFDPLTVKGALISLGLIFGSEGFYHYHEGLKKTGKVVFTLASATKPGVFDEAVLESYGCKGLTLFLDMRASSNPLTSFEQMLKTAVFLRQMLSGELREGQRELWTPHSARHCRDAIRHYMVTQKQPEPSLA
jgi:FtsZ-interacting cell division protein ZipA